MTAIQASLRLTADAKKCFKDYVAQITSANLDRKESLSKNTCLILDAVVRIRDLLVDFGVGLQEIILYEI
jgi:hypothetical protein